MMAGLDDRVDGDLALEAYLMGLRARMATGPDATSADLAVDSARLALRVCGFYDDTTPIWLNSLQVARDAADWETLRKVLAVLGEHGEDPPPGLDAGKSWARALLAHQDGAAPAEVEGHYLSAIEHAQRWKGAPAQARIHADFAVWLAGQSRHDEAAAHAEAATQVFARLRATVWQEELDAALSMVAV